MTKRPSSGGPDFSIVHEHTTASEHIKRTAFGRRRSRTLTDRLCPVHLYELSSVVPGAGRCSRKALIGRVVIIDALFVIPLIHFFLLTYI